MNVGGRFENNDVTNGVMALKIHDGLVLRSVILYSVVKEGRRHFSQIEAHTAAQTDTHKYILMHLSVLSYLFRNDCIMLLRISFT